MVRQGKILGHILYNKGTSMDKEKIQETVDMTRPRNTKEVQSFMGHCVYYC